jgi:glycerol uptake facilitator protein
MKRDFPWSKVGPYIVAQMVGAFLGALGVYLTYRDGLVMAGVPNVWSTGPGSVFGSAFTGQMGLENMGSYSLLTASLTELFGTAVLLWGVLASGDSKNTGLTNNLGPFLVGGTVLAVGLSLGGPSGYAINPARDFGPRLLGTLVGTQGLWAGGYWLIPLIVPVIGAVVGIYIYDWLVTANLPKAEPVGRTKSQAAAADD